MGVLYITGPTGISPTSHLLADTLDIHNYREEEGRFATLCSKMSINYASLKSKLWSM